MQIQHPTQTPPLAALPARPILPPPPPSLAAPPLAYSTDQLDLQQNTALPRLPLLKLFGQSAKAVVSGSPGALNRNLMQHFEQARHNPLHQPVYAALEASLQATPVPDLKNLEKTALQAAQKLSPSRSAAETTIIAYEALLAASIEKGLSDPNFFDGQADKLLHYLSSAVLAARSYRAQPQSFARSTLASGMAYTLGFAKEVLGPPFSREDMQANRMGIRAALHNIQTLSKAK